MIHASEESIASDTAEIPAKRFKRIEKRCFWYAAAMSALLVITLGAMIWFVGGVETLGRLTETSGSAKATLFLVGLFVLFAIGTVFTYFFLHSWAPKAIALGRAFEKSKLKQFRIGWSKRSVLLCLLLIFCLWLPWIVLQYPCAMNGDTYNQLYQYQTPAPTLYTTMGVYVDAEFVDHHPVFDTLLYGWFLSLGDMIGSQNNGLFLFSVFQNLLTALGLAASCCYLERLGVPKLYRLISLLFAALFPVIPIWASTMTKDTLYGALFIFFALMYVEIVVSRGKALESSKFVVGFIAVTGLCILTKKPGIYIAILSILPLFLTARKQWKQVLVVLLVPVLVFQIGFQAVVYPMIGGVEKGGSQEMMGVLYQQVITVAVDESNDITPEEYDAINGVLDVDGCLKKYDSTIIDPVKNRSRRDATSEDVSRFLQAYVAIGLRHPVEYAESICGVCAPLLAPGKAYTLYVSPEQQDSWVNTFAKAKNSENLHLVFDKPEWASSVIEPIYAAYKSQLSINPFFMLFFGRGFYAGWIPIICLVGAMYCNRRNAFAFWPMLLCVAVLLVSPASSPRYTVGLLYLTPLMMGLLGSAFARAPEAISVDEDRLA